MLRKITNDHARGFAQRTTIAMCLLYIAFGINPKLSSQTYFQSTTAPVANFWCAQATNDSCIVSCGWTKKTIDQIIFLMKSNQEGDTLWTRTFDEFIAISVDNTNDGGYILTGHTDAASDSGECLVIKVDSIGLPQWTKKIWGFSQTGGRSIKQLSDGGYLVCGTLHNLLQKDYMLVVKLSPTGSVLWSRRIGGVLLRTYGFSTTTTSDNCAVVLGSQSVPQGNLGNIYLLKFNNAGDTLWTAEFGGTNQEIGIKVIETIDKGFALIGSTQSFGAGEKDIIFIKTDSLGNLQWAKTYGALNTEQPNALYQNNDGDFLIGGFTTSFNLDWASFLLKIDSVGNFIWANTYEDIGYGIIAEILVLNDSSIFTFGSGREIMKLNSVGKSPNCYSAPVTLITTNLALTRKHIKDTVQSFAYTERFAFPNLLGPVAIVKICSSADSSISDQNDQLLIAGLGLSVFPNPFNSVINILLESEEKQFQVQLSDAQGRILLEETYIDSKQIEIDSRLFQAGIYLLRIYIGGNFYYTKLNKS